MAANLILTGKAVDATFCEETHTYTTAEGRRLPSVSRVIRPLTEAVYGSIDPEVLRRAADFGTAVHACTEYLDQGELDDESIEPEWAPYVDAYRAFLVDFKPNYLGIELRLACEKYAGTLDRYAEIDGDLWIIDLKTTSSIHPHVGVQLAGYDGLLRVNYPHLKDKSIRLAALQLRGDGTYRLHEFGKIDDKACFNALLTLTSWKENHYD